MQRVGRWQGAGRSLAGVTALNSAAATHGPSGTAGRRRVHAAAAGDADAAARASRRGHESTRGQEKDERLDRVRLTRVLLVEDDPSQLRTIKDILTDEGFLVVGCGTAGEAMHQVERESFGVAIVDLKLPDLLGTDLLKRIRVMNPRVRVIIHTGYGSFETARDALNAGAFAYVEKLSDPSELISHVHRAARDQLDRYADDLETIVAERTASLRESEARWRALSELSSDFAFSMRLGRSDAGEFDWASDAFVRMVGWSPEIGDRRGWPDLVHAEDRPSLGRWLNELRSGRAAEGEFRISLPKGETRWLRLLARSVDRDEAGRLRVLGAGADITDRKSAEQQQRLMMRELDHRVKNNLAIVMAIADRSLQSSDDLEHFAEQFRGRIRALAHIHDILARTSWSGADLESLAVQTVSPYTESKREQVAIRGDKVHLPSAVVTPLAMALHELATNAVKYGALSLESGSVDLSWRIEQAEGEPVLHLVWQESDGPEVHASRSRGFGTAFIEEAIAHQLQGEASLQFNPEGVRCEMRVPLTTDDV
ncbi:MAG: HWE histidine kinase domain-containing protein [Planctomycetota bacterium]|nr:HWE histidine kinase domain-containing protein [Planctomycetota bacterium]